MKTLAEMESDIIATGKVWMKSKALRGLAKAAMRAHRGEVSAQVAAEEYDPHNWDVYLPIIESVV